jgi:hypothetical protein
MRIFWYKAQKRLIDESLGLSLYIRVGWKEFISLLLEAVEEVFMR